MYLKSIELSGFKSFGKKTELVFGSPIVAVVGPNGSGKCVTGDTLLVRKKKRFNSSSYRLEEVAIRDVKPGDEISTLEEKSGRLIFSRVKGKADMGVREVFKITTVLGKEIRATANHPFLCTVAKSPGRVAIFIDGANLEASARHMDARVDFAKLLACFPGAKARYYQADFAHAGQGRFFSKLKNLGYVLVTKPVKVIYGHDGSEDRKANFDVEISVDASVSRDSFDCAVIFSGDSDFAYLADTLRAHGKTVVVISAYRATGRELRAASSLFFSLADMPFVRFSSAYAKGPRRGHHDRLLGPAMPIFEQVQPFVKRGMWTHASELKEGELVATVGANGKTQCERIVSIVPYEEERVYDVEIEHTHNFVANQIITHNSNVAEAFRFVLGEQSMKSLRSKKGEDLIWGGSPSMPRMNRASVKVVFDNTKRLLDIDFVEVVIERVVHRDGQNEYLLNGTQVRLKDVIRLLAGANIGGSGYQIISQGEADRILNASPRERREMVEDALGLKLYQHKKVESERKLEETGVNIDKTKSLRRELAPHLTFLRQQVEKIEKAREMKAALAEKLNDYLVREHAWISQEEARLKEEEHALASELKRLSESVSEARSAGRGRGDGALAELERKLSERELKLADARRESERISRELGRAEGALEANTVTVEAIVPVPHVRNFARELYASVAELERVDDISRVRSVLSDIRSRIKSFIEGLSGVAPVTSEEARQQVRMLTESLERVQKEEGALEEELEDLRKKIAQAREEGFAAERDLVGLEASVREVQGKLLAVQAARESVAASRRRFEEEVRENVVLVGTGIRSWEETTIPAGALLEDRSAQEKRRREIERLKIKIEESGTGSGDRIVQEFRQIKERDEFLAKELIDLEKSAASLKDIIAELDEIIDERFREGLKSINESLGNFFLKLFGGGHAKLSTEQPRLRQSFVPRTVLDTADNEDAEEEEIEEEEELYTGLSISVSLPRKKIRGLEVLSGGERALTSIALIFSMSQVNPPPFLILDETDAALDEANSKRYADMIVELSKKSQLIVITHNRATMSAAGELYGVTMGQDGVSKILSVKLEEAERVAK